MIVGLWEIDGTHLGKIMLGFNFMLVWMKCKRFVILKTSCVENGTRFEYQCVDEW
jgi:hypothetical protein